MKYTIVGFVLSILTALNLIFYEKVVKHGSYIIICIGGCMFYLTMGLILYFTKNDLKTQVNSFFLTPGNILPFIFFVVTMSFSYAFYFITKGKNVELSSLFDIAYIPILFLFDVVLSEKKIDVKFIIASALILLGVYIINKD